MHTFPKSVIAKAPPIKIQGIKTKLAAFIVRNIRWDGKGRWVEPFLGSGAVLFNAQPLRALISDTNKHIIAVYQAIQNGTITAITMKAYLEHEGTLLESIGEKHYYDIRQRFNAEGNPYDFIFLNRACFNGIVRFNSKGGFNVPFCKKPTRFAQSYVTKICNQIDWVSKIMLGKDWEFKVQDWTETLSDLKENDFVYLDPPYIGRHTDYFGSWDIEKADALANKIKELPCAFAYSMWKKNDYRENEHLIEHFSDYPWLIFDHFYHVGSTESLRNSIEEALIISPTAIVADPIQPIVIQQLELI